MDGLLMIAMNKHREICSIQSSGGIMLLKDQVNELYISVVVILVAVMKIIYVQDEIREKLLFKTHLVFNIFTVYHQLNCCFGVEGHEMQ